MEINFHFTVYYFPTKEAVAMREPVSFFTPVSYGNLYASKFEKLLEFADDCFFFSGHKAVLVSPRSSLERSQRVELQSVQTSMWKTAFKIVAWLACFVATVWNPIVWCVPVGLLALKGVCRMTRSFHIETDPLQVPRMIKFCAPKDFRNLRNHEPSSDLSVLPHAENGVPAQSISVHSHLLPKFFQDRASSRMSLGLDEQERKKCLDLSGQQFATSANIHQLLDYYYGVDVLKTMKPEKLLSLFQLADFVEAVELKKEILQLLLHMPESREDIRLAPVFRNMLLSPQVEEEEFERLFEWYIECAHPSVQQEIRNPQIWELAERGDVRAQLLCSIVHDARGQQYASRLAAQEIPLGQFTRYLYLHRPSTTSSERSEGVKLIQASARSCMVSVGILSVIYFSPHSRELYNVTLDIDRAFELAQKAAEKNSLYGVLSLGLVGIFHRERIRDSGKIFECMDRAARIGYRYGEYFLARCYENGIGTKVDRARALEFYLKAKNSFEKNPLSQLHVIESVDRDIQRLRS